MIRIRNKNATIILALHLQQQRWRRPGQLNSPFPMSALSYQYKSVNDVSFGKGI